MTEASFFLGIDAGGSRCKARLVDPNGQILAEVESGPANARIGIERLKTALIEIAEKALTKADIPHSALPTVVAGMGIAGITRPGMRAAIENLDLPYRCRAFDTDAAIACLGAHAGADGAILILGTGSIACIRDGDKTSTIGGYGFPISDEGSGAALGLSGVRHALRALDGRTKATPLSAAISKQFNDDTAKAIAWMDQATPYDYGSFAPLILDFAEKNDEIARSIVEDAAKHVERFIETIFAKGAKRCALVGGVAPRMIPWLRARTTSRLVDAAGDGLDGALLLAGCNRFQGKS
ncbi:BadF/BadG/BcrA/BcrD ATPase family protein [Hyphococcus sp. DH-69]|uniref:BadF/BadG/BcrA/BcrD ATPase family protein n=1 Tax=Hyphococcus formosus TaxID=3143534 RepID=UPI00398B74CB